MPAADEGPYHRDEHPYRRDVVEDREGVLLRLGVRLTDDDGVDVEGATVEIWQCDASGRYSGFPPPDDSTVLAAADAPRTEHLPEQTFLRGRQRTDAAGMVEFRTIYPGWYPGRTVHVHVMVHEGSRTFTSQLHFPDDLTDSVLSLEPYARRPGRDTTNGTDGIFPTGGEPAVLDVTQAGDEVHAAIRLVLPGRAPDGRRPAGSVP